MPLQSSPALATLQHTLFSELDVDGVHLEVAYTTTLREVQLILESGFGKQDVVGFNTKWNRSDTKIKVLQLAWSAHASRTVYVLVWSIDPNETGKFSVVFSSPIIISRLTMHTRNPGCVEGRARGPRYPDRRRRLGRLVVALNQAVFLNCSVVAMPKFHRTFPVANNIRRCVELSCLSRSVHHDYDGPFALKLGLAFLYSEECGGRLDKESNVRSGYWLWGLLLNADEVKRECLSVLFMYRLTTKSQMQRWTRSRHCRSLCNCFIAAPATPRNLTHSTLLEAKL